MRRQRLLNDPSAVLFKLQRGHVSLLLHGGRMIRSISCSAFAVLLALPAMGQTSTQATLPFAEPRRYLDGQDHRSLRGFLHLLLRGWQKEESIPADQTFVGRLRESSTRTT